jgi:uncharacterized cupin superfamily protein
MLAVDVSSVELEADPLRPDQIISGNPEVSGKVLWESPDGKRYRGIWQITPGVAVDIDGDEMFVVVSGSATVELLDTGEVLELRPGTVGILAPGTKTRWTVHETLRKAYQIDYLDGAE